MQRTMIWKWLVPTTVALTLALAGSASASDGASAVKGKSGGDAAGLIAVGAAPIPFSLRTPDGDVVELEDYLGEKAMMLTFWSFFCGPCREEIPLLDELTKKYAEDGFEMLAINLDGPKLDKAVRKYMGSNGFTFQVLWEEIEGVNYKTADAYGVVGTPTLVLVGKDGTVNWTHVGREEVPVLDAQIRKAVGLD
jgi:thiol-disulfide isomerase/thioredoxin